MKYYIGWDVGAWHCSDTGDSSKDALVILDESLTIRGVWEANLSKCILTAVEALKPAEIFVESVFTLCKENCFLCDAPDSSYLFAIDTPLGWPDALRELLRWLSPENQNGAAAKAPLPNNKKIKNPYLHRATEMEFEKAHSTVQDRIGSQSTKALFCLRGIGAKSNSTGIWEESTTDSAFIETYPAPCTRSLDFLSLVKSVTNTDGIDSVDKFDALVCAVLAYVFDKKDAGVKLSRPKDGVSIEEGWIFAPDELLPIQIAVSYGKLFENKLPTTSIREIVTNMQLGMIVKSALSKERLAWKETIAGWLTTHGPLAGMSSNHTGAKLRELFLVLNRTAKEKEPKTKKDKIPSAPDFEAIARQINELIAGVGTP